MRAVRITPDNAEQVAQWAGGRVGGRDAFGDPWIVLPLIHGAAFRFRRNATVDDYIVRKPDGRFYVEKHLEANGFVPVPDPPADR
ncbi:hypothetical protein HNR23_002296 [Nocardiopsis mwathae]|uniref:Uncharacterized protein n=1 Tax=Nocardiopsis mwathae TaxID=1472723 RepID=A0A7X0D612_9ACTN|nr:hypothetical protein [Nocardiopsis mwathae]MBB6172236.1 hypothetical protein [Nocardiopsis mwathae]